MKALIFLPLFATLAVAQPFGAGFKLGGTLTDAIRYRNSSSDTRHFVGGPYVELRLPAGFAIEADALYSSSLFASVYNGGSTWQFPVMAKYKFAKGVIRPYVEGGVFYSHLTDLPTIPDVLHRSNYGIVLGGGLELKLLFLRITPEVRYNGAALKNIQGVSGFFESNRNQALFLVGFGF